VILPLPLPPHLQRRRSEEVKGEDAQPRSWLGNEIRQPKPKAQMRRCLKDKN
jgi:hypothetical protein